MYRKLHILNSRLNGRGDKPRNEPVWRFSPTKTICPASTIERDERRESPFWDTNSSSEDHLLLKLLACMMLWWRANGHVSNGLILIPKRPPGRLIDVLLYWQHRVLETVKDVITRLEFSFHCPFCHCLYSNLSFYFRLIVQKLPWNGSFSCQVAKGKFSPIWSSVSPRSPRNAGDQESGAKRMSRPRAWVRMKWFLVETALISGQLAIKMWPPHHPLLFCNKNVV